MADEEIKYTLDGDGYVAELSKQVVGGLGESVGVSFVSATDRPVLERCLDAVGEQDYFGKAIEVAAMQFRLKVRPVVVRRRCSGSPHRRVALGLPAPSTVPRPY